MNLPKHVFFNLDGFLGIRDYARRNDRIYQGIPFKGGNEELVSRLVLQTFANIFTVAKTCFELGVQCASFNVLSSNHCMTATETQIWREAVLSLSSPYRGDGVEFIPFGNSHEFVEQFAHLRSFGGLLPTHFLGLGVNFDGRGDIVQATKIVAQLVKAGELDPDDPAFDAIFERKLWSSSFPEDLSNIDLLVNFKRVPPFLGSPNYHITYSELYPFDGTWLDFTVDDVPKIIKYFDDRDRRHGT